MLKYKNFYIYKDNNELVVLDTNTKQEKRKIVESNSIYAFKVLKTKIKAMNGIDGLLNFIENCINKNFGTCWIDTIIKGM